MREHGMSNTLTIRVYEIVGTKFCVASDDGQKVYDEVCRAFRKGQKVALSFQNVESLTPAFLNTAVGQLYGTFSEEQIRAGMDAPKDIEPEDIALLKRVVDSAKEFFRNPDRFKNAAREALGDDDG